MSALKQNDSFHRQLMLPPVKSPGTYEVITALILENRLDRERYTETRLLLYTFHYRHGEHKSN